MDNLPDKVKVVLTSIVTWAVAIGFVVTTVVAEVTPHLADGQAEGVAKVGGLIVTWLGVIVSIIRKVTTVPAGEVGLLPQTGDPFPQT